MQDTRLQKKSSLEAAQKEAAQLQKQLADLKADLQRAESTIEVSMHDFCFLYDYCFLHDSCFLHDCCFLHDYYFLHDYCFLCGSAALPDLSLPHQCVVHQVKSAGCCCSPLSFQVAVIAFISVRICIDHVAALPLHLCLAPATIADCGLTDPTVA